MYVVFISSCEKRALKRTRRILDSYAFRIGNNTWSCPITEEALQDVWRQLKSSATRQTAVTCHRNDGYRQLRLLWRVGNRHAFSSQGFAPIARTEQLPSQSMTYRLITQLAHIGGLTHDLGKATQLFQSKLKGELPQQDPIRHEWVSSLVVQSLFDGDDVNKGLESLDWDIDGLLKSWLPLDKKRGLTSSRDVLQFIVATHHKLFGNQDPKSTFSLMSNEPFFAGWRNPKSNISVFQKNPCAYFRPAAKFDDLFNKKIKKLITRLPIKELEPETLRAIALLARAFVIMADHTVSARKVGSKDVFYANTKTSETGERIVDQGLHYHLSNVGQLAHQYAFSALRYVWEGLSDSTIERVMEPAQRDSRFTWQNDAVDKIYELRRRTKAPILIMNIARTGSGKTRMNAKAVCAANIRPEVRFSTALGLKTLTLQTADAYSEELHIPADTLNCVIGDRVAKKMHTARYKKGAEPNDDENPDELIFETGRSTLFTLPEWLTEYGQANPNAQSLLAPPVLVSTIDYLVAAGEPGRQGHHTLALNRLINSDLILDEIDDYDPKAFVAVLRLVEIAALVGANVITSSATLPKPMAAALGRAFESGARMRARLNEHDTDSAAGLTIISDFAPPKDALLETSEHAGELFSTYINSHAEQIRNTETKKACLTGVNATSEEDLLAQIAEDCDALHEHHRWLDKASNKYISIGLVRIANIRSVIAVARHLSLAVSDAYVATYHSNDFAIARYMKEKTLDTILNRKKKDNIAITGSAYIRRLIDQSTGSNLKLIVVASPVEEVGRDHDFDWAVIEPSSVRSIIQTAGRVNRHRLEDVETPNIRILNRSLRCARDNTCDRAHYNKPGFESQRSGKVFPSHSMCELLGSEKIAKLTSYLRYDTEVEWSKLEDDAISEEIKKPISNLTLKNDKNLASWMTAGPYRDYPLRSNETKRVYVLRKDNFFEQIFNERNKKDFVETQDIKKTEPPKNTWLSWSHDELLNQCEQIDVTSDQGFSVEITDYTQQTDGKRLEIEYHHAFGFRRR